MIFSRRFWELAGERAVKTGGQFVVAALGADFTNLFEVDALGLAGAFGAGVLLSVATSVASAQVGPEKGDPSVV